MTTETTLEYAFGTTPEEVIRERLDVALSVNTHSEVFQNLASLGHADDADFPEQVVRGAALIGGYRHSPDNLLTVLDALKTAGADAVRRNPYAGGEYAQLRIDMLAALGIKEG